MNTEQDAPITCRCNHCPGEIEFTVEQSGETVTCPHCGMETTLATYPPKIMAPKVRLKVPWKWIVISALVCSVVGLAIYLLNRYPQQLADATTALGGLAITAAAAILALMVAVLWILFPVFMYFKMNELIAEVRKLRAEK
jgi:hypothetical protein